MKYAAHKLRDITQMANDTMVNKRNGVFNFGTSINQKRNKKTSKITKIIASGFKT